jgi:hypothetical protein
VTGRPAEAYFSEVSARPRVEQIPLAHLSIELGHLYLEDFAAGSEQLRRHFREMAPWLAAAKAQLADRLGPGRTPRVSTCFLIDDYFTELRSRPDEVVTDLLEAATEHGITIDYLARESCCAVAGDVPVAELVLDRIVADPPPGTGGLRPSPQEDGWLYNSDRLPGESLVPAMTAMPRWQPPTENARNRHSIVVAVEIFSWEKDKRVWSCPYLAAVWQLLRLGMLRHDGRPVAVPEPRGERLPREWQRMPAVLQLNPNAPPFSAYRTVSVLAPRFVRIEAAAQVVLGQVAADEQVQRQIAERAAGERFDLSADLLGRIEHVMAGDVTRVIG